MEILQKQRNKEKALFDYADKILSIQQTPFIPSFPKNIHHLVISYLQLCYYICIFPYRLVFNRSTYQYEIKSNTIQRVLFAIFWACSMAQFSGVLTRHIMISKPGNPVQVLLLLGGVGHLTDFSVYLVTIFYYKEEIKNLINYFILHGSLSSDVPATTSSTYPHYDSGSATNKSGTESITPNEKSEGMFTFKRMAIVLWFLTLAAGIKCTEIVDKIFSGESIIEMENSYFYLLLNETVLPNLDAILDSSSLFSHFLHVFLTIVHFSAYMQTFCGVFIYGLEIIIALTMQFIASHFVSSLTVSKDYWKPSSNNVLSSFIIVRKCYRMINKIFGWLLFYSVMGEFPNFTFYVVFQYTMPTSSRQWPYTFGLIYVFILLIISSLVVNELSKLKDWMQCEDSRQWSLANSYSMQRRMIFFELSLNRQALYAHGFFQLSLPALVSTAAGILSNALIIIQLSLSNNG